MYTTLFDSLVFLAERPQFLKQLPRWKDIPAPKRALIAGVVIVVVTLLLGAAATLTRYAYPPLVILGVFYGVVVSKPLTQFLAPKFQSLLTGFLGGITTGNIGSAGATLRKVISTIGTEINSTVAQILGSRGDLSGAVTVSLWILILTALVILAANAYYANLDSSPVGNPVAPAGNPAPIVQAAAAAGNAGQP